MRICKCGGRVVQAELTSGRQRWNCLDCGRYEIFSTNLLTKSVNDYNGITDNRKASDDSSLSRGAL